MVIGELIILRLSLLIYCCSTFLITGLKIRNRFLRLVIPIVFLHFLRTNVVPQIFRQSLEIEFRTRFRFAVVFWPKTKIKKSNHSLPNEVFSNFICSRDMLFTIGFPLRSKTSAIEFSVRSIQRSSFFFKINNVFCSLQRL